MDHPDKRNETDWPVSWSESRKAQLQAMARATPARRLEWLEQALRFAQATGALATGARDPEDARSRRRT